MDAHHVLIDAPPVKLEVEFDLEVRFGKANRYKRLEEVSPVVRALARQQFDDYVKRVRVFVHPGIAQDFPGEAKVRSWIEAAIDATDHVFQRE